MIRERLRRYRDRIRDELVAAFREDHTPHQIAASFAIGVFITSLPTGGLGIGLFFVFVAIWSSISKPAIFASIAVLNPVVKPAVYFASYQVGSLVLRSGSVHSGETTAESALLALRQLLLGNVVVAVGLAVFGYATVRSLVYAHRQHVNRSWELSVTASLPDSFRRQ